MLEPPASLPTSISCRVTLLGTGSFRAGTDRSPTRGRHRRRARSRRARSGRQVRARLAVDVAGRWGGGGALPRPARGARPTGLLGPRTL